MSCDICGREACAPWMHSLEEQDRYSEVIEAFDRARALRAKVRLEIEEEALARGDEADIEEDEPCTS